MDDDTRPESDLASRLTRLLAEGLSDDAVGHATQVAAVAGMLNEAFEARGFRMVAEENIEVSLEDPELIVADDPAVVLLGFDERGRGPPQGHRSVLPVRDASGLVWGAGVRGSR